MRIVCLSDTHGQHSSLRLPAGDVLIHAGDFTERGTLEEVIDFNAWLRQLPYRHKLVIAGNHELCLTEQRERCETLLLDAIYLQDRAVTINGVRFYGSPWQPDLGMAFSLPRGAALAAVWRQIPSDTEVLITHTPPWGILDRVARAGHLGCEDLRCRVEIIRPRLHVFGHSHPGYGQCQQHGTRFVNAAAGRRGPLNPPIVVDLPACR